MKKAILSFAMFAVVAMLAACTKPKDALTDDKETDSSTNTKEETQKEVVFLNYIPHGGENADIVGVRSVYDWYNGDENTLYAFAVELQPIEEANGQYLFGYPEQKVGETKQEWEQRCRNFEAEKAVELMERMKIPVLYDYPLCAYGKMDLDSEAFLEAENWSMDECVVVGTEAELKRVFGEYGLYLDGYFMCARSAPRPDAIKLLKEKGWDFEQDFGNKGTSDYHQYLGEEEYVVQTVNLKIK